MDLFTEGQKITLFFQKNTNQVEMTCSLEKLYEDRIELQLPQYFMRYVNYLQVGMNITAKAFTKLGTVDFNSIIITSPLEDCFSIELDYNSLRLNSNNEDVNIKAMETIEIQKDENRISNALSYFIDKYPKLWREFFEEQLKLKELGLGEIESVTREEDAKVEGMANTGGRIDLLIRTKNCYIILENKIDSEIIIENNVTQLERYYNYSFVGYYKEYYCNYYPYIVFPFLFHCVLFDIKIIL